MEQGSLPERYLSRSVLKHIKKQNKTLVCGAAVGNDFSLMGDVVTAEGVGSTPVVAWAKAMNNFACSGGVAQSARLTLLMPEITKESWLKGYMSDFNNLAERDNVQIIGGHSDLSANYVKPCFVVTIIGKAGEYRHDRKLIKSGFDIVMVGDTAVLGTNLIAHERAQELKKRFSPSYIADAYRDESEYSIVKAAGIAAKSGACYMHDVSGGGVYGALWQLGVWMRQGFLVEHVNIPIRQEAIEICEYFNINPYLLDGTGALIVVTKDGNSLVNALEINGIQSFIIGKVTEGKEKMIVMNDTDKRCLSPVNGDEYYHI